MLYDSDFLRELDEQREKTVYARIISLDLEESPLQQIEGQITSGSVNVDGSSAVRRTCSLSMVAKDINIDDYYWGLHTKFKLEIGVENTVSRPQHYDTYPDIIWFKMGTYVITSFSCQLSTNSYTISIQGKDKMCLLNGDVGGVINARTDFGTYDYYDVETGITTNKKYPIKKILWDAVHAYANEPFHNIILNDLDELGLELLDYKYDTPMYLIRPANTNDVYSVAPTLNGDMIVSVDGVSKKISEVRFERLIDYLVSDSYSADKITLPNSSNPEQEYFVAKIEYGQTCGYRTCELVYAGDLIANVGESLTSVFDKIKAMLGEFEYFYDLDGRFIFQRKKCLVNTDWSPQVRGEDKQLYVQSLAEASNSIYTFNGSILISSFQNSPNLGNLKNDFTVWGERTSVGGNKYPIHMRYAIDNKPNLYVDYDGNAWTTKTPQEILDENELKARYATTYDYETLMDQFEKNPDLYPEGFDISKDNKWWNLKDWAEYYSILFESPPGNKHPDDEMQYYTQRADAQIHNAADLMNTFALQYRTPQHFGNIHGSDVYAIGIFFYNDEYSVQIISRHGHCVHTYGEWLDVQYYVNGTNTTGPYDPTYRFFPNNNTIAVLDTSNPLPDDAVVPPGARRTIQVYRGTKYYYYPTTQIALDELWRPKGLIKAFVYSYNPTIPPERKEKYLEEQTTKIVYEDPNEGRYKQVDWREIIYRMAIDYRRHNHDDDFEVQLARRNYPLYSTGITGYEQYYTDLEGFWRQLYCPMFDDDQKKANYELEFKQYEDITNKNDLERIYVKGVYKPLAQKVTAVMEGRQKPSDILGSNDRYYHRENVRYFTSENNGFTFTEFTPADNTEWVEKCVEGKVYTRQLTDLSNTFKIHQGQMQPYGNTINFLEDYHYYFLKVMNLSDPQNPTYELITVNTKLTPEQRLQTYHSLSEDGDDMEFTLDRRLRLAQARSNPWADLYIYDNKTYCMADIVQNASLKNLYYDTSAQKIKQYLLQSPTALNSNLTAVLKKNAISYYVAYIDFYVDPPVYTFDSESGKYIQTAVNDGEKIWWHKDVFDYPDLLNFWFDFLEGDGTLRQFTTKAVGDRPKAVNETTIKSIYYRDTPKVIYSTMSKYQSEDYKTGYSYFIIPDSGYENMFAISPQGISAKNRTDELLYQHSYCTESVNLTAIPIYYLEPNNRVYVFDEKTGINGYYVISKLSYSLAYNGMMQVTATKAPENSILEREE